MYINLGLPQVIKDITSGLSEEVLHDCLSHILLTGGNTHLSGFGLRLTKDLRELLPEYSKILEVRSCPGTHSWNVAMGSTYVPLTVHPGNYITVIKKLHNNIIVRACVRACVRVCVCACVCII